MSDYGIQVKGTSPILKRPVRPLSSQSPHLSVYKEGGDVKKRRKFLALFRIVSFHGFPQGN